jgi:hypothetical protein
MGVRENKVERYLDSEVKRLGGTTRKWVSPGRNGVPDRIVIWRGVICFVELKTVDGVLSSVQGREIDRLREHGAVVFIASGKPGVDEFIKILQGITNVCKIDDNKDETGLVS